MSSKFRKLITVYLCQKKVRKSNRIDHTSNVGITIIHIKAVFSFAFIPCFTIFSFPYDFVRIKSY